MSSTTFNDSSRRHFLASTAMSLGPLVLAAMCQQRAVAEPKKPIMGRNSFDLQPKTPTHPPRATAMISMFMQGGPSQVDLLDPKPLLSKLHMQQFPGKIKYDNAAQASSKVFGSPWKFRKYGASEVDVSELLPHFATIVDDVLVIR